MVSAVLTRVVAWWTKTPLPVIRAAWRAVVPAVIDAQRGANPDGSPLSGSEKFEIVKRAVIGLIPDNRQEIASQIIRILVELTLIAFRISAIVAAERIAKK